MQMSDLFAQEYLSDKDTETHHVCGICGELKPVEAFYRDGKTRDGKVRYRRDCKDCYKQTRLIEMRMKRK